MLTHKFGEIKEHIKFKKDFKLSSHACFINLSTAWDTIDYLFQFYQLEAMVSEGRFMIVIRFNLKIHGNMNLKTIFFSQKLNIDTGLLQ